ncbi:MAG: fibronectin type III domain-containing protein [Candidatus Aenigmatarchaeota archaeon]
MKNLVVTALLIGIFFAVFSIFSYASGEWIDLYPSYIVHVNDSSYASFGFKYHSSDNNSALCILWIDNEAVNETSATKDMQYYLFPNKTYAEGSYTWYVSCENVTTTNSSTGDFYVDKTGPYIEVFLWPFESLYMGPNQNLTIEYHDIWTNMPSPNVTTNCSADYYYGPSSSLINQTAYEETYDWSFFNPNCDVAEVYAYAIDDAGNDQWLNFTIGLDKDGSEFGNSTFENTTYNRVEYPVIEVEITDSKSGIDYVVGYIPHDYLSFMYEFYNLSTTDGQYGVDGNYSFEWDTYMYYLNGTDSSSSQSTPDVGVVEDETGDFIVFVWIDENGTKSSQNFDPTFSPWTEGFLIFNSNGEFTDVYSMNLSFATEDIISNATKVVYRPVNPVTYDYIGSWNSYMEIVLFNVSNSSENIHNPKLKKRLYGEYTRRENVGAVITALDVLENRRSSTYNFTADNTFIFEKYGANPSEHVSSNNSANIMINITTTRNEAYPWFNIYDSDNKSILIHPFFNNTYGNQDSGLYMYLWNAIGFDIVTEEWIVNNVTVVEDSVAELPTVYMYTNGTVDWYEVYGYIEKDGTNYSARLFFGSDGILDDAECYNGCSFEGDGNETFMPARHTIYASYTQSYYIPVKFTIYDPTYPVNGPLNPKLKSRSVPDGNYSFYFGAYWNNYNKTMILSTDSTAPDITNVSAVNVTKNSAVISWETDEDTIGTVYYGTDAGKLNLNVSESSYGTTHSLTLTGLSAGTTYYYKIVTFDLGNNGAESEIFSFATKSSSGASGSGSSGGGSSGGLSVTMSSSKNTANETDTNTANEPVINQENSTASGKNGTKDVASSASETHQGGMFAHSISNIVGMFTQNTTTGVLAVIVGISGVVSQYLYFKGIGKKRKSKRRKKARKRN